MFLFLWEESSFFMARVEGTHFHHVFKGNRALGGVNTPGIPPISGHFQHFCSIQGKVCFFLGGGLPFKIVNITMGVLGTIDNGQLKSRSRSIPHLLCQLIGFWMRCYSLQRRLGNYQGNAATATAALKQGQWLFRL